MPFGRLVRIEAVRRSNSVFAMASESEGRESSSVEGGVIVPESWLRSMRGLER